MRLAALLCDIGSARIPDGVLAKSGPLTPEDWDAVRRHPEHSAAMLGGPGYDDLRPWILAHHERPDGRGYPSALPASDIPLEAAIVSVATAWEAMTDDRPHRPALTPLLASQRAGARRRDAVRSGRRRRRAVRARSVGRRVAALAA